MIHAATPRGNTIPHDPRGNTMPRRLPEPIAASSITLPLPLSPP
jgi:hypothetical protein